jgi:predicted sugar kinase
VELVTNHEGVGFHPDDSVPSRHSVAEKLVEELNKDRGTVVTLFDTLKESIEKMRAKIRTTKRNGKILKGERIIRVAAMQLLVEVAERSVRNSEEHLENLKEAISQAESRLRELQEKSPKNVTYVF